MKWRLMQYLLAFGIVLILNFALPRLMPGNPIDAIYGQEALVQMDAEMRRELTRKFRLDDSVPEQFVAYISGLMRGDLGYSYHHRAPVGAVILSHLPWTILLVGMAFISASIIGVVAGIEAGWRRGTGLDRACLTGFMSCSGLPAFFLGVLMILLFGVVLNWFPVQGARTQYAGLSGAANLRDLLAHLALPVATLTVVFMPGMFLLSRSSMVRHIEEPYVLTARAKGLQQWKVRYRHVARNSLLPVITAAGLLFARRVVTGALFVEIVFSYPGMGRLMHDALLNRDYPLLQGGLLLTAILVLGVNLMVDAIYRRLDPRIE